jgi:hypothetical protein
MLHISDLRSVRRTMGGNADGRLADRLARISGAEFLVHVGDSLTGDGCGRFVGALCEQGKKVVGTGGFWGAIVRGGSADEVGAGDFIGPGTDDRVA